MTPPPLPVPVPLSLQERMRLIALAVELEGTIGVYRSADKKAVGGFSYFSVVSIGQAVQRADLLHYVCALAGAGQVSKKYNARRERRSPLVVWQVNGRDAVALARSLLPYMLVKREQAQLVAGFPLGEWGVPLSPETRDARRRLYERTLELNAVGPKEEPAPEGAGSELPRSARN